MNFDWSRSAEELGTLHVGGEGVSLSQARRALELWLGEEGIATAVRHACSDNPGSLLAWSVLRLLKVPYAFEVCIQDLLESKWQEDRLIIARLLGEMLTEDTAPRTGVVFDMEDEQVSLLVLDFFSFQLENNGLDIYFIRPALLHAIRSQHRSVREKAEYLLVEFYP
jgi:hypothetical protein